jgi:hypothetical protein
LEKWKSLPIVEEAVVEAVVEVKSKKIGHHEDIYGLDN